MSNKLDNCNHKSLEQSVFREYKVDELGKFVLHQPFKKGARVFKTDLGTASAQRGIFAGYNCLSCYLQMYWYVTVRSDGHT